MIDFGVPNDRTATEVRDTAIAARCVRLRDGDSEPALFLIPGAEGDAAELTELAAAMAGPNRVYALAPQVAAERVAEEANVSCIVQPMLVLLRQVQPKGPYRLGGYSFGALLAVEMAQQLRAEGQTVDALFLIDGIIDDRYWTRHDWLVALLRRALSQLKKTAGLPVRAALKEIRFAGKRLFGRIRRRRGDSRAPVEPHSTPMRIAATAAKWRYEPSFYDGQIILFAARDHRYFGCDTARQWRGRARRLYVQWVEADHLSIVTRPTALMAVASGIDHHLNLLRPDWRGLRPRNGFARPMVVSTMRWFSTARVVHSMVEAGFGVSACRPASHPMESVDGLSAQHRLSALFPLQSLRRAIRQSDADILLPVDERAIVLLRRLYDRDAQSDPTLAALISHSLGQPTHWPVLSSRTGIAQLARRKGVPCPNTRVVRNKSAARALVSSGSLPLVLKTDGSWGGCGVAIVDRPERLNITWQKIARPPSRLRGFKRFIVNFETDPIRAAATRLPPTVNAQEFVSGREGIATAACLNGEVTSLACFRVLETAVPRGPAASVCTITHPGMEAAVREIVAHFKLSGFLGVDFMLTPSGEAFLLEINPRITPTCHMLIEAGIPLEKSITLFPPELLQRPNEGSSAGVVDVPLRAPALVQRGEQLIAKGRYDVICRDQRSRSICLA